MTTVHVTGIPPTILNLNLQTYFDQYGEVQKITYPSHAKDASVIDAYITYSDKPVSPEICKAKKIEMDGQVMYVSPVPCKSTKYPQKEEYCSICSSTVEGVSNYMKSSENRQQKSDFGAHSSGCQFTTPHPKYE